MSMRTKRQDLPGQKEKDRGAACARVPFLSGNSLNSLTFIVFQTAQ